MTESEPLVIAGRYRLDTTLAIGGMGVVWKGWDERLKRPVAVKQLRVNPGLSPAEAATARHRAMREARNTARLHHPHAIPVYDVVEHDGEPCLIMEFLPSVSLQEAIRSRGTLAIAEVARIGTDLAQALTAAHRVGIVHRDVKPGNVLLAEDGTTKLTDFGISHALGDSTLTATGMLTGTPAYLAPEVARGQPASFESDVFSLGATLYTASEGTPPFGEDPNPMALLYRIASGDLRPPQRSGPLTSLLIAMLGADPRKRPTMTQVSQTLSGLFSAGATSPARADLETLRPHRTPQNVAPVHGPAPEIARRRSRPAIAAFAAAVVLAAAGIVAFILTRPDGRPGQGAGGGQTRSTQHTTAVATKHAPTADELAQAITEYYALMPTNLQAGWSRLTPAYQQRTGGGFTDYQTFWGEFAEVRASDAVGHLPDMAQATITYVNRNGTTTSERTAFQLILSGGRLKINDTTVL
ncbi:MAG: serine/threonine-protein kinase [Pseudonocardiales bacterium]